MYAVGTHWTKPGWAPAVTRALAEFGLDFVSIQYSRCTITIRSLQSYRYIDDMQCVKCATLHHIDNICTIMYLCHIMLHMVRRIGGYMVHGSLGTIVVLTAGVGATVFGAWMLYREFKRLFERPLFKSGPFTITVPPGVTHFSVVKAGGSGIGTGKTIQVQQDSYDKMADEEVKRRRNAHKALEMPLTYGAKEIPVTFTGREVKPGTTKKLLEFFEVEKPNKKVPQLWMSKSGETVIIIYPDRSYDWFNYMSNEWREYRHYKLDVKKLTRYEFISNIE